MWYIVHLNILYNEILFSWVIGFGCKVIVVIPSSHIYNTQIVSQEMTNNIGFTFTILALAYDMFGNNKTVIVSRFHMLNGIMNCASMS